MGINFSILVIGRVVLSPVRKWGYKQVDSGSGFFRGKRIVHLSLMEIHVHIHHYNESQNLKLDQIMASISELTTKVDALQTALNQEQEQIAAAIAQLQQTVTDLQAIVASGGTEAERQALADKLDAITSDLQSTIGDTPTPQP